MLDFTEFKAIVEKVDPTKTPHESTHLFRMIMDKEDGEVMGLDAFCDVMQQAGLDRAFNQKHVRPEPECLLQIALEKCTLHNSHLVQDSRLILPLRLALYKTIIITITIIITFFLSQLRAQGLGLM